MRLGSERASIEPTAAQVRNPRRLTRSGVVWAIDAKNYSGKVQRIDKGGWFSTDLRLYVGGRDCTQVVHGMARQVAAIRTALGAAMTREFNVEVRAALCFVNAEWSLFAKPFDLGGVWIGWPKALGERIRQQRELTHVERRLVDRGRLRLGS